MHFPRGMRGRWLYNSPVASVVFDSRAFLRQAEEKFRCGRISETEYNDLRHDLQKMLESSEYQALKRHMPRKQVDEHYARFPETQKSRQEYEHQKQFTVKNLKIQKPSVKPLAMKTFFLDGKERIVHFIDDRAFVLLDNDEPRELTFKDELKKVLIDNTGEELTLCFDGKSVEFEVNGQRHIMRLGIPGRELYINNHPYAVQFGGPPLLAMLEDGCIYKIYLSGPAPQVIISDKPEYEFFAKHHGRRDVIIKQETDLISEEPKSQSQCAIPSSSTLLQDVDMRVKPENLPQTAALMNKDSPFYIEADMKDVDWRQFPPSVKPESKKNPTSMVWEDQTSVSEHFETWYKEDSNSTSAFCDTISNQSEMPAPKEPVNYDWKPPVQHPPPPLHAESNGPPPSSNQEMWYYKHNTHWESNDYRKRSNPPPHQQGDNMYEATNSTREQAENVTNHYDPRSNPSHMSYSQRQPFQSKQTSGRSSSPDNRSWTSNTDREGSRHDASHFSQSQEKPTNLPHRTLLPPPPFPPLYPFIPHEASMLQRGNDMNAKAMDRIKIEPVQDDVPVPDSLDSETHTTESATMSASTVDVESLLQKLIATGIINAKPFDEPEVTPEISTSETEDKKENEAPSEEIPQIELTSESLKIHHPGVISALHKGLQCATCGMRFKEMQSEQYSNHLDWHFRMNRREKDGAKKAICRRWYYEIEDWIQFEEFEDVEERVPSYFEMQTEDSLPEVVEIPPVVSVPATNDDQECCPVCCERFQLFWVEEEEEWHYRNAVRHDNVAYHPACYEDFKKTSEAEALKALESLPDDSVENIEIITEVLNSMLDDVCKTLENESADEENHTVKIETVEEVPLVETHSEEEILEGKPGEEEIIGVISESDIEMDTDAPKTESKMVVMQSGGITLKVKAESLQSHSPSNPSEKDTKSVDDKPVDDEDIEFRPPTPDPNFEVRSPVSKGRELSGLCCIM